LVLDDEAGGSASLNRRALLALLQEWPQSRRALLPPRAADSEDEDAAARFAQAPNAELYLKACACRPGHPAPLRSKTMHAKPVCLCIVKTPCRFLDPAS
jgi:hypothetical protein